VFSFKTGVRKVLATWTIAMAKSAIAASGQFCGGALGPRQEDRQARRRQSSAVRVRKPAGKIIPR